MAVGECGAWLFEFGVGLHAVTHGQHGFVIQFQLGSQLPCGLTFTNTSHQQDHLPGRPLAALKDSPSVQIVNRPAAFTTMYFQLTGSGTPKLSRLLDASLAFRTFESSWMKMLEEPLSATFMIK